MTSTFCDTYSLPEQCFNANMLQNNAFPENYPQCSYRWGSDSAYQSSDSECSIMQEPENFNLDTVFSQLGDNGSEYSPAPYFTEPMSPQEVNVPTCTNISPSIDVSLPYCQSQQVFTELSQTQQVSRNEFCPRQWNNVSGFSTTQLGDVEDYLQFSDIEVSDDDDDDIQNRVFNRHAVAAMNKLPERKPFRPVQPSNFSRYHTVPVDFNLTSRCRTDTLTPRQRPARQPILSQFLLHALETPEDYGTMIRWVDRQGGVFEFVSKNKENLAKAWGLLKNNRKCMTYPKMARALRKYIENGVVLEKMKNRLRYKFLSDFLERVRSGREASQLSSLVKSQMYHFSRR